MSRIYEALQKAEAERDPEKRRDRGTEKPATDRESVPTNQHPQVEAAAPAPVFSAPAAVAEPEYELPAISAQARAARFAPVAPAAVPVSDRLDLNAVPRRPWSPPSIIFPLCWSEGRPSSSSAACARASSSSAMPPPSSRSSSAAACRRRARASFRRTSL